MLMGNRAAILVEEDFDDVELTGPMRALKDVGIKVIIVGSQSDRLYTGKRRQVKIRSDASADEVPASLFDVIVIPGGYAPDKMRMYVSMVNLVKEADSEDKIIAAICHGPQMLISADIIRGRKVTSWPSVSVDLVNAGADWVDRPVVQDGNIITSRKAADIPKFNSAIIAALKKRY